MERSLHPGCVIVNYYVQCGGVFDYIPFPVLTYTTGMTHFQNSHQYVTNIRTQSVGNLYGHERTLCLLSIQSATRHTPNIYVHHIEKNGIVVACRAYGGEEKRIQGCVGRPEGKRPLGRPRHRWEDNIEKDLQEVGCGAINWVELAQEKDRWRALVNAVMNLRVS